MNGLVIELEKMGGSLFGLIKRIAVLALLVGSLQINAAKAASVSSFSDTLSTIKESVPANHTFTFTITDSWAANETLTLDFPPGFSNSGFANSEPEDFDITDDGVDQTVVASGGCSAAPLEIEVTTVDTTDPIGFTFTRCSGDATIAAGSVVVIKIGTHATVGGTGDDQIVNQTAAQNNTNGVITLTGGGGYTDTGSVAVEIVADNDVTVNAVVDPRITCSFTGLTTTFASLTGPVTTSNTNTTITVSTNAANGFNISVRDEGDGTNPGLYKSTVPTYLIGSADNSFSNTATLTNDVDGFGIQGSVSGGSGATVTIDARFNQSGNTVGGLERTAINLASSNGAVASRVITIVHKAAVSGLAPAGVYTDTLTYVCTGVF
jgi:hypothetical protein